MTELRNVIDKAIAVELLELADNFMASAGGMWTGQQVADALRRRVAYRDAGEPVDEPKSEAH